MLLGNGHFFRPSNDTLVADQRPSDHGVFNQLENNVSRHSIPGGATS